jgi:hypothetical protein
MPARQQMAALRPSEDPWNSAEIFYLLRAGATPARTRTQTKSLQLFDGRRIQEILVRIHRVSCTKRRYAA